MTPNLEERIGSVIRALTDVILPALPEGSGLAQEQAMLSVRHLQILLEQLDAAPEFERQELADAVALGTELLSVCEGGARAAEARNAMRAALDAAGAPGSGREARARIDQATASIIKAVAGEVNPAVRVAVSRVVLAHEAPRILKDRQWFAAFGFDTV
jgi:hypothetical protein